MTSATSMVAGYGYNKNPSTMNSWLKSNGGFASGDLYVWAAISKLGPFTFQGFVSTGAEAAKKMDEGYNVIINVRSGTHWVLPTSHSGSTFHVMDPGFNVDSYPYSAVVRAGVYKHGGSAAANFYVEDFETYSWEDGETE
mmetsp:Transcript_15170/g.12916  ORF Transcript_15170/g.12916 Transcript_15170/m.12916 type:complete len:140 (-) Transcript_15170:147-566(-)